VRLNRDDANVKGSEPMFGHKARECRNKLFPIFRQDWKEYLN
jgi:hypothetical protein